MKFMLAILLLSTSLTALANMKDRVEATIKENFPEIIAVELKHKLLDERYLSALNPVRAYDIKKIYRAELIRIKNAQEQSLKCEAIVFKKNLMTLNCGANLEYYKALELR